MAKHKKKTTKPATTQVAGKPEVKKTTTALPADNLFKFLQGRRAEWFLFALASLLYIQTVSYDYTMDDAIVITDNMFTTEGIKGIPGIFSYDTFYGFFKEAGKGQLVSGGRYRPFTLAMFAVERTLFGSSPFFSHLINVLLFAFTCMLVFRLLKYLFAGVFSPAAALSISFITALLFTTHPIHSEVVANIKGRDEIMSLLGCMLSLWYAFKWMDTKKKSYLLISLLSFIMALLSKENAVSMLVWLPGALYIFKKNSMAQSLLRSIPYPAVFILFFLLRGAVLNGGGFSGAASSELLNNPFLKWEDGQMVAFSLGEKMATVFYCLGMYLKLLIFPHPLTHDYYPRQIPIMDFSNNWVIISLVINIFLFAGTIWLALKKHLLGFAGLLYWVALLIVSNLFFPIGTNMGERFVYMSSMGFCMAIGIVLYSFFKKKESRMPVYIAAGMALLLSIKTITRNPAWKNNLTLFETDIKTSANSAKLNNTIGSDYIKMAGAMNDGNEKPELLSRGKQYLQKALTIHPLLKNAWLNMGNAEMYLNNTDSAIAYYNKALAIDPAFKDAKNNLVIAYRSAGRQAGEKEKNLDKSIAFLNKALLLNPGDYETLRLLGVAHGIKGEHTAAIDFFTKALALNKADAEANYNLGVAYQAAGNMEMANLYINKAFQLNPALKKQ